MSPNVGQAAVAFGTVVAAVVAYLGYRQSKRKDSNSAQEAFIDDLQEDRTDLRARVKELESTFDTRLASIEARMELKLTQAELRFDAKLRDCNERLEKCGKDRSQLELELIRMRRKHGENGGGENGG